MYKNVAAGTTFGHYRKIGKVNHLYRKFGTFNNFFAKKFRKKFTSGFLRKQTLFPGTLDFRVTKPKSSQVFANLILIFGQLL
jgi:hypothetical protein